MSLSPLVHPVAAIGQRAAPHSVSTTKSSLQTSLLVRRRRAPRRAKTASNPIDPPRRTRRETKEHAACPERVSCASGSFFERAGRSCRGCDVARRGSDLVTCAPGRRARSRGGDDPPPATQVLAGCAQESGDERRGTAPWRCTRAVQALVTRRGRSWIFSCRASIATKCSMRLARVSGFLGVWMRKSTE